MLEQYFQGSKRITAEGESGREWLEEDAPVGGKAVEGGDLLMNGY